MCFTGSLTLCNKAMHLLFEKSDGKILLKIECGISVGARCIAGASVVLSVWLSHLHTGKQALQDGFISKCVFTFVTQRGLK